MLVDCLHELLGPEPDIVELVHQEESFVGLDLLLDLRNSLRVEFFKEVHHGCHILLVFTVE